MRLAERPTASQQARREVTTLWCGGHVSCHTESVNLQNCSSADFITGHAALEHEVSGSVVRGDCTVYAATASYSLHDAPAHTLPRYTSLSLTKPSNISADLPLSPHSQPHYGRYRLLVVVKGEDGVRYKCYGSLSTSRKGKQRGVESCGCSLSGCQAVRLTL